MEPRTLTNLCGRNCRCHRHHYGFNVRVCVLSASVRNVPYRIVSYYWARGKGRREKKMKIPKSFFIVMRSVPYPSYRCFRS